MKLTGKQTHVNWDYFHDKPLYFFCFYNRTVNLKSLEEAVNTKIQINVRNFYLSGKQRDLLIVHGDVHKSKKKLLSPKTMPNHEQNWPKLYVSYPSFTLLFVNVMNEWPV